MRGLLMPCVALLLVSGATTGTAGARNLAQDTVAVHIFQFSPRTLEIKVGTTVTWTNGDQIEHTVTAGIPDSSAGDFSGTLATKGSVWSRKFDRPGTYPYYCSRHTSMRGEIRVTTTGGN